MCYWASPETYTHIAIQEIRRLDIVWTGKETKDYDALVERAKALHVNMPDYVKAALKRIQDHR